MKRLRILRRWFARKFGYARLVCLALLIGIAALRIADPAPIEELRVRTFDTFQRIDPRVKTARPVTIVDIDEKSLAETRPVAMAADADRGPRHQSDQARRRRDRLRRHVRRARPAQSRRRGRHVSRSRRGDPGQAAGAAEQRSDFRRCDAGARAWCSANPDLPEVVTELDKTLPVTGLAMLGEDPQPFMFDFPGLLRNIAGAGKGGRRPRPVHDQARARRHRPAGADDHAGPGRDHAVPEFRNAAGGDRHRHDLHQVRSGRHQEHRRQGLSRFRPTATASSGFISRVRIPRSMFRPPTCSMAASRPKRSRASWC